MPPTPIDIAHWHWQRSVVKDGRRNKVSVLKKTKSKAFHTKYYFAYWCGHPVASSMATAPTNSTTTTSLSGSPVPLHMRPLIPLINPSTAVQHVTYKEKNENNERRRTW